MRPLRRVAVVGLAAAAALGFAGVSHGAAAREFHFKTPSGNIHCRMNAEGVSCLLRENTWRRLEPRPADCETDWFPTDVSMFVSRRTGRWAVAVGGCRGDVGPLCLDDCFVLRYGRSVTAVTPNGRLGMRCTSARTGLTCIKLGSRPGVRGFRLAREGYAILR